MIGIHSKLKDFKLFTLFGEGIEVLICFGLRLKTYIQNLRVTAVEVSMFSFHPFSSLTITQQTFRCVHPPHTGAREQNDKVKP